MCGILLLCVGYYSYAWDTTLMCGILLLLNNNHVIELKDYKKSDNKVYKYFFNYLGTLKEYKVDEKLTNLKKYVRLGIIPDNYFPNNYILFCLEL